MEPLDQRYIQQLDQIAEQIQSSKELASYLEEEEEDDFMELRNKFEPGISAMHREIAEKFPLQLISFEKYLLDEKFEGLFLPKILGFSVLRGELTNELRYARPQDHFKEIIEAICNSSNFDYLKKRIGQSVQMGLAFSSEIWATNLINAFSNKRVKYFLQAQRLPKFRNSEARKEALARYSRQFTQEVFQTSDFPSNAIQLDALGNRLEQFLINRVRAKFDNTSLQSAIGSFISNDELMNSSSHYKIAILLGHFFELEGKDLINLQALFSKYRANAIDFDEMFFDYLMELYDEGLQFNEQTDQKMLLILSEDKSDDLSSYHALMTKVHRLGFSNDESIQAISAFYNEHEGLSTVNQILRTAVLHFVNRFLSNIEEEQYEDFFRIVKIYAPYMHTFANQRFNQGLKEASLKYVKRLIKHYPDKRGKDYQDVKKFVTSTFLDHGFYNEKQIAEIFKTRRKKRVVAS